MKFVASNRARWSSWLPVFLSMTLMCDVSARSLRFHGPVIQWHEDPATTATFSWIEEVAPDLEVIPVWRKGRGGFGYGDHDDVTVLDDMKGKYERVYLVKKFDVESVPANATLKLGVRYDDAFIAFINGREVARSSNIEGSSAGAEVTDDHEAEFEEIFEIKNPSRFLKKGENLIAIEGHNKRDNSSDFTLTPRLIYGKKEVIRPGEEWHYLAGGDPSIRWYLGDPTASRRPQIPMEDDSEWTLKIRRRDSGDPFRAVPHEKSDFGNTGNPVFRAKVTELAPDTEYRYVLLAANRSVKTGWFRTAPLELKDPVRFIMSGDMGTRTAVPMCRAVAADDPLFVAIGGDLAYANGRAASLWYDWLDNWEELLVAPDGRSIPIIAGIGNHETKSFSGLKKRELWKGLLTLKQKKAKAPFYYTLFDLPGGEPNFAVDFGNYMSIVVMDSGYTRSVESQTNWLEKTLEERVRFPHLFTMYHRPAWGTGIKSNNKDIQKEWCPLFEKYQIDCAFENDHHVFKRSFPITGGRRDNEKGILYLGDGAWGATLRPITEDMLEDVDARRYLAKWKSLHHVWRITLSPDGKRLYEAFDTDREIFDSFTDSKSRRSGF